MDDSTPSPLAPMQAPVAALLDRSVVKTIRQLSDPGPCHLVGGALRDALLGVRSRDFDIVVSETGHELAAKLAEAWATRVIELGGDRFAAFRVIADGSQIDIWDRGGATLESDLQRRDLTIHSFAVDLHRGVLVDPFAGREDLAQRLLRMTTRESFADDPLRVLRLCRFVAQLPDFRVDPATTQRASDAVERLGSVAAERIHGEIESTLQQTDVRRAIALWIRLGVAPDWVLNQPIDIEQRREIVTRVQMAWDSLASMATTIPVPEDFVTARMALLLRALEGPLDPSAGEMAHSLRQRGFLSTRRLRRVLRVLTTPPPLAQTADQRWFLHQLGEVWKETLYVAAGASGWRAPPPGSITRGQITAIARLAVDHGDEIFAPRPLLSGADLRLELGVEPGPQMGRILKIVFRRQIEGKVDRRSQALDLAGRLLQEG